MNTVKGLRCDGCGKLAEGKDIFSGFVMGPSISAVTAQPDGRFPGIASASNPKQLAQLHACPSCKPKIRRCLDSHDFITLPEGPLKKILTALASKDRLRNLGVH